MTTTRMKLTEEDLVDLYRADPGRYEDHLDTLLGKRVHERGYRTIDTRRTHRQRQLVNEAGAGDFEPPALPIRQFSFRDLGEAFLTPTVFRRFVTNPFGMGGGRARTSVPSGQTAYEAVGGGALGPDTFADINGWLATVDRLLDARMLERLELALFLARQLLEWQTDVRLQEPKIPRYSIPTTPPGGGDGGTGEDEGVLPTQEFPTGNMTAEFVRAAKMHKQALSLEIAWESFHFDQTGDLMEAAEKISDRFAVRIEERMEKAIWGISSSYRYMDALTATYRNTGSYVNLLATNELKNEANIDLAEQQLLKQTDPATGLEVEPGDERMLIVSPGYWRTAWRLQNPIMVNTGALSDPEQVRADGAYNFQLFRTRRGVRLMTLAVPKGLGLTVTQANKRWIWGSTKRAFRYRQAKDFTTYRYTIADSPVLSRRDVLMAMDCSEMGGITCVEPRHVILSTQDA